MLPKTFENLLALGKVRLSAENKVAEIKFRERPESRDRAILLTEIMIADAELRLANLAASEARADFDEALAALTASELNEWVAWLNDHTGGESGPIVPPANLRP